MLLLVTSVLWGGTIVKHDIGKNTVVKVPNDSMIYKVYSDEEIDYKLIPPQDFKRLKNE